MISEIPDPIEPYRAFEKNIKPLLDGFENIVRQAQAFVDATRGPDSIRKVMEQSEKIQSTISNLEQPLQVVKNFQGKFGAEDFQSYRDATERADSNKFGSSDLRKEIAKFTEDIIVAITQAKQEIIDEINRQHNRE